MTIVHMMRKSNKKFGYTPKFVKVGMPSVILKVKLFCNYIYKPFF